jgi:hemerythrin superfamily protein
MASISDVIKRDHREIEVYYQNIIDATDDDSKTKWQNQFTWELARHCIGEELVVHPAMQDYMGAVGTSMAEKDRQEHQVVSPLSKK